MIIISDTGRRPARMLSKRSPDLCHELRRKPDPTFLPILAAQKTDAQRLAADAQARGWIDEADRHMRLIERLDALIGHTQVS